VVFRGFKDNHDHIFGRGLLYSKSAYLLLEKQGNQISAYCSSGNEDWFIVGKIDLVPDVQIHPGIHAIGHINRMIYPGAYPHGTAIRFKEINLWG
jgi:hypothetical protein